MKKDSTPSKKILVLLSTYNGEKYIIDQLNSINGQVDLSVYCLIRDDGSKDNTFELIREFCNNHPNFTCYKGENVGVVRSFNDLLQRSEVDGYEYFAFADQDDVWMPNKLAAALQKLYEVMEIHKGGLSDAPALYFGNLLAVNSQLAPRNLVYIKRPDTGIHATVVAGVAYGCTEVFNKTAVDMYRKGINSHIKYHDYWMFLICSLLGNVVYDDQPFIMYRQHEHNVVGFNKSSSVEGIKNLSKTDNGRGKQELMIRDFLQVYGESISDEKKAPMIVYLKSRNSILSRFKLLFDPRYHSLTFQRTMGFKIRVLLNR